MKTNTETIGTPTANGIIKGRPGKGRVLSLEQRKRCYAGHAMTEENTFRYTAKRVKGKPKPIERAWCKKCRAQSRKSSAEARRLREAKEAATQKRETNAALKARKGAKAAPVKAASPKAAKARKAATKPSGKAATKATPRKGEVSGNVGVGCCAETFRDAPSASKHFNKHSKQLSKAKAA